MKRPLLRALVAPAVVLALACDDGTSPTPDPVLEFDEAELLLGEARTATVVVRNSGTVAVGPIEVVADPVRRAGIEIPGAAVTSDPVDIPTLNPGDSAVVAIAITGADGLQSGAYSAQLHARVQGSALATAAVSFLVPVPGDLIGSIEIVDLPSSFRQGDLVQLSAVVRDTLGGVVDGASISWSTLPNGRGLLTSQGEFVPYATGELSLVATSGSHADTVAVSVEPRGLTGSFSILGATSETVRYTSDLWIHGDVAYSGTWGNRSLPGNTVFVWDISGGTPVRSDSVQLNAFTVNDVKIRADGTLAVATHEYMAAPNAITLLDMTDPLHPEVAGEYTTDEPGGWVGIHNVWIEGDYAYIVVDGTASNRGLWILDVSDPSSPRRVARFHGGSSFLHDVYVRDGLAFLSHWDAGLIILDVGHGIRGGSPTNPIEVSRVRTSGGQTHNAWYWPETGYVFVGEEDFGTPGHMHIVDASDLLNPVEVGSFRVAGDAPHNFWLDEERSILYMAWYSQGLQAIDVSGRLLGSLDQQGRVIAASRYAGDGPCWGFGSSATCTWAPQVHGDYVYVSDMNSGIWKLQPSF